VPLSVRYEVWYHSLLYDRSKMSMTDGILTALPAPEGYEVNFANPPQVGNIPGYIVTGVGLALAGSFLGMRLYTRCLITRNFGLEDGK
jgi:hypothetical protein